MKKFVVIVVISVLAILSVALIWNLAQGKPIVNETEAIEAAIEIYKANEATDIERFIITAYCEDNEWVVSFKDKNYKNALGGGLIMRIQKNNSRQYTIEHIK